MRERVVTVWDSYVLQSLAVVIGILLMAAFCDGGGGSSRCETDEFGTVCDEEPFEPENP